MSRWMWPWQRRLLEADRIMEEARKRDEIEQIPGVQGPAGVVGPKGEANTLEGLDILDVIMLYREQARTSWSHREIYNHPAPPKRCTYLGGLNTRCMKIEGHKEGHVMGRE